MSKKSTIIFGIEQAIIPYTLHAFASEKEVYKRCPGLDVAEGDWAFFDTAGVPLHPVYSVPAQIKGDHYTHGIYSLKNGKGPHLESLLHTLTYEVKGEGQLKNIDAVRQFLGTQKI